MRASSFIAELIVFALCSATQIPAQTKEQCLTCHGENSLSMEKRGKNVSLYVDGALFKRSVHGDIECIGCHERFKPDDIPHVKRIKPVDCLTCHDGEKLARYKKSIHGKTKDDGKPAAACVDCHSKHNIQKVSDKDPQERKELGVEICAKCHSEEKTKYSASSHGIALASGVHGAPTCIDCHGEHEVQLAAAEGASTSRKLIAAMCLSCHLDNPDVRAKVGPSAGFVSSYENSVHGQAVQHGNEMARTSVPGP